MKFKSGFLVFLAIAVPVFIFDCIFKADYMYIYDCSLLDVFKFIADAMPHRLVWTLVALAAYFIIEVAFLFSEIGIAALCSKIKAKKIAEQTSDIDSEKTEEEVTVTKV